MADAISKADYRVFQNLARQSGQNMQEEMGWVPTELLTWLERPGQDWFLGDRILKEMCGKGQILGYTC